MGGLFQWYNVAPMSVEHFWHPASNQEPLVQHTFIWQINCCWFRCEHGLKRTVSPNYFFFLDACNIRIPGLLFYPLIKNSLKACHHPPKPCVWKCHLILMQVPVKNPSSSSGRHSSCSSAFIYIRIDSSPQCRKGIENTITTLIIHLKDGY